MAINKNEPFKHVLILVVSPYVDSTEDIQDLQVALSLGLDVIVYESEVITWH